MRKYSSHEFLKKFSVNLWHVRIYSMKMFLTRLNKAMKTITVVVMVASGRRTNGLLTTALDMVDNHWQDSNFSGNSF